MNILPTHPKYASERYFADMARLNCDVAYTAYYAQTRESVIGGPTGERYKKFVKMAHERGMPACIQIQSTLANLDDLDIAEAQYTVENTPHAFYASNVDDKRVCFASFASEAWKKLLNEFTGFFVTECGFDWVVYEEPMYAVDVPGTQDRFHSVFKSRYPGAPYPTRHEESASYVKVQLLKKEVLAGFYRDLLDHAKSVGAKRCGIMPWFFVPIYENTPYETLDTSCDLGRIIHLDSLDFVVVRMQPDNIYSGATIDIPSQVGGRLYYTEVMAHSLGKPVICVNNAINEHRAWFEFDAIPFDFFRASTLAAVAAAPEGMSHHWYVPRDFTLIEDHWKFLSKTNDALRRLGGPQTPVAFVYSYRGTTHSWPYRNPQVYERFWAFAHPMLFEQGPLFPVGERMRPSGGIPFKVVYADTLALCLERNPDLRLLVLDEYYPLTAKETELLRDWLEQGSSEGPRALFVFASGFGYSANPDLTGDRPLHESWPSLLNLCGFDSSKPATARTPNRGRRIRRRVAGRLPKPLENFQSAYIFRCLDATPRPDTEILFDIEEEGTPYLTRARVGDKGGRVFTFCAGLWPRTLPPVSALVRYILEDIDAKPIDADAGPGVLFNFTKNGFLIATNPTAEDSYIDVSDCKARYWNVRARRFESGTRLPIAAYDFLLLRRLLDGRRVLDLRGASILELEDGVTERNTSRLVVDARGSVTIDAIARPEAILVNGEAVPVCSAVFNGSEAVPPDALTFPGENEVVSMAIPLSHGEAEIELVWGPIVSDSRPREVP